MSDLRALKHRYLTYLETQWGGSAKMIENYDRYLERFLRFAKVKHPRDITEERVASFRLYLTKQPGANIGGEIASMKQRTQNYYLIALRMFLKYLIAEGYETLPPNGVQLAKLPRQSYDRISPTELACLRAAPDRKTIEGKRDHAILELLCSTGVRTSELCALSIEQIDLMSNEFLVGGTDQSSRTVYLSDTARAALSDYLQARTDDSPALFIRYGRKANNGSDLRIHARAVQRMLKHYTKIVGITSSVTPHSIRHTFADELIQHGADVRSVQTLMGHTSIYSTQVYRPNTKVQVPKTNKSPRQ